MPVPLATTYSARHLTVQRERCTSQTSSAKEHGVIIKPCAQPWSPPPGEQVVVCWDGESDPLIRGVPVPQSTGAMGC